MFDLLKTDLRRALKDKLIIVLCIIAGAFAIFTPLLYKGIFLLLDVDAEALKEFEMLGLGFNAKTLFFSSFSLSSNFGLILPIFTAIILCKDFSHGTVRNKIICGKSRASVYFSMLITCVILITAFILIHATLTLLVSLTLFNYQSTAFTASDFGYLMASIGLELVVYVFVCSILTFFIVFMKNAGVSIVMYFVVLFAMTIIGTIIQTTMMFSDPTAAGYKVLEFFNFANPYTTTIIGSGKEYKLKEVLSLLIPNLAFSALFIFLGFIIFRKKDLK